jgi:hypothetical protein
MLVGENRLESAKGESTTEITGDAIATRRPARYAYLVGGGLSPVVELPPDGSGWTVTVMILLVQR